MTETQWGNFQPLTIFNNIKPHSLQDILKFGCYKDKFNYGPGDWYCRKRWLLLPFRSTK